MPIGRPRQPMVFPVIAVDVRVATSAHAVLAVVTDMLWPNVCAPIAPFADTHVAAIANFVNGV